MLALKKRNAVSFVFVPYQTLLGDTSQRLAAGGLRVGLVKGLISDSPLGVYDFDDVYVGTFDDLGRSELALLLARWEQLIVGTRLGMIVVDECHNLYDERDFRSESFKSIPNVPFTKFWKVLLLTATAGTGGLKKPLRFLNLNPETHIWDLVQTEPLLHVDKEFREVDEADMTVVAHGPFRPLPSARKSNPCCNVACPRACLLYTSRCV